ncbi:hypothetical protein HMPREF9477_00894 [Lachnospiraceae bacterium 2_1_46FAA]|jgi:hypothetical protein|nr:hypothetical protein HMPREF9477_00894 [Lachnospiraceae bacterium 2_1_46FAA]
MEIVTGYRGKPHITSEKWADLNRGIIGAEEYVLGVGRMFESELVSNNLLKIYDGCGVFQGREFSTSAGQSDEITIENGTQGEKRIDLIVARYTKNEDTKIETIEPVLIKGTPSASDPAVPKYTEGNIRQGDLIADMPLYEVELNGINVVEVRPLFRALMDMNKINKYLSNKENPVIMEKIVKTPGITLNAFEGKALSSSAITPPTVEGYRCIGLASGWGEGQVGLVVSPNGWAANCTNVKKTYNAVALKFLYLKSF